MTSPLTLKQVPTHQYKKDVRKLRNSGFNLEKLNHIINALARNERLPEACRDHALKGMVARNHACHIGPDWILVYRKDTEEMILLLIGTGTHRDTLGIE